MPRYRDERDALRLHADKLRDDLHDAEARLRDAEARLHVRQQQDEEEERQLAFLRSEVERLRVKAGEAPPPPAAPPRRRLGLWLGGFSLSLVAMGAVTFLTLSSGDPVVTTTTQSIPAQPAVAPAPPVPPATVFIGGEVIEVTGGVAEVGDACLIEARLGPRAAVSDLQIWCGDTHLHDAAASRANGSEHRDMRHVELAAGDGTYRHRLRYANHGPWSGPRSQVDIDSYYHRGRVWKAGPEPWGVRMHLDSMSFPRQGPLLNGAVPRLSDVPDRRWRARREKVEGAAPKAWETAPDDCELVVRPIPTGKSSDGTVIDCRINLRCGGTIYYGEGETGFMRCPVQAGRIGPVVDDGTTEDNSDPKLELDLQAGTARVEDVVDGLAFSAEFTLTAGGCVAPGLWTGVRRGEGERAGYVFSVGDSKLSLGPAEGETRSFALPVECGDGALHLQGDGAPTLFAGPGGATWGGFDPEGTALGFRRRSN